ncbi:MAG: DUF4830 domain-containing protein [Oscillospiraceae bacterium]
MFIFSIKLSKLLKKIVVSLFIVLVALSVFNFGYSALNLKAKRNSSNDATNIENVNTNDGVEDNKISFLKDKDLKVKKDPVQVVEVIVPKEMENDYLEYNELQLKQGFDMRKYKGKKLKQWTYKIEGKSNFFVSILELDKEIVGCHITDSQNNKMTIEDFFEK